MLRFRKSLDYRHARALWDEAARIVRASAPSHLILDFTNMETIDSAGISVLRLMRRHCVQHRIQLDYRAVPDAAEYFLHYVESEESPASDKARPSLSNLISSLGGHIQAFAGSLKEDIRFVGQFLLSCSGIIRNPGGFRWRETLYYIQAVGSNAMLIIFVLNFLVGLVMAYQAAVQLRQFGANIYVADLVSLALTRELGPVFTAIILAGRSGSSFAAEIGTMKVNEEIDALTVMGFDVTKFLVIPKVFALAICCPLLTLLADAAGILGGLIVGVVSLDLTAVSFMEEVSESVVLLDIVTGLIKSLIFAVLIGLVGCLRGLQTEKEEDSVGRQTTSAVVSGSFLIIFADAVLTVIFNTIGW